MFKYLKHLISNYKKLFIPRNLKKSSKNYKTVKTFFNSNENKTVFVVLTILIFLYYWKSFLGYFQSDEWFYFTQFLPITKNPNGLFLAFYKSIVDAGIVSGGGHLTPIYNVFWFLNNLLFGTNYTPYILVSIVLHSLNSFFVYRFLSVFTNSKKIGFMSSIFFALNFIHFQAVTWIMAYINTQLSVTFLILTLIFCFKLLHKYSRVDVFLFCLFFISSLLSKESAVILFILVPLLIILQPKGIKNKKLLYLLSLIIFCIFAPYRFLLPKLIDLFTGSVSNPVSQQLIDPSLYIYRLVTYPLKMLAEVFIPAPYILWLAEFLTPLAYPSYAVDKSVRGLNFLTFTQSVGSDMLIYVLATIFAFVIIIFLILTFRKDANAFISIIFGTGVIILSSLPLLFVSTFAPWWGYVTFIDSRHIYMASLGGALVFATVLVLISKMLRPKFGNIFLIIVLILFMISNYFLLQKQLQIEASMGQQRKTIISTILNSVPKNMKKKVIIVESDTGYYGFESVPPFQTGLGQILAIKFYEGNSLPVQFLSEQIFSSKGPVSQGFKEYGGYTYGYFNSFNDFLNLKNITDISEQNIYTFHWDGKNNAIRETTNDSRKKFRDLQNLIKVMTYWKKDKIGNFSFMYPPSFSLHREINLDLNETERILLGDSQNSLILSHFTKDKTIFFHEYIPTLFTSNGIQINDNFKIENITRTDGTLSTLIIVESGIGNEYFVPSYDGGGYLVLRSDKSFTVEGNNDNIDLILKTIYHIQ